MAIAGVGVDVSVNVVVGVTVGSDVGVYVIGGAVVVVVVLVVLVVGAGSSVSTHPASSTTIAIAAMAIKPVKSLLFIFLTPFFVFLFLSRQTPHLITGLVHRVFAFGSAAPMSCRYYRQQQTRASSMVELFSCHT